MPSTLHSQRYGARRRPGDGVQPQSALVDSAASLVQELAVSPYRDSLTCVVVAFFARLWVKGFDALATSGTLDQKLTRKIVHSTAGPLFMLTWPLFSANPSARLFAAAVPALNLIRLVLAGTGVVRDEGLIKSVSRGGGRDELLAGPLYYCVVLIASCLLCWRDNAAGIAAVALMCGGDGMADIVGRRWGGAKLPYNTVKSYAGSAAMLLAGGGMFLGLLLYFGYLGYLPLYPTTALIPAVLAVSSAATVVESLPVNQWLDDNISVPCIAAIISFMLLAPAQGAL